MKRIMMLLFVSLLIGLPWLFGSAEAADLPTQLNTEPDPIATSVDVQEAANVPELLYPIPDGTLSAPSLPALPVTGEIHINTREELIELLNTKHALREYVAGDQYRYGIKDATIYLHDDFTISTDDIFSPIPENTRDSEYHHSFYLDNCNVFGNDNSITITQGTRTMYPLFGIMMPNAEANGGQLNTIKDLSLIYDGNVHGTAFAQHIQQSAHNDKDFTFENITLQVNGSILPLLTATSNPPQLIAGQTQASAKHTNAFAYGFAFTMDGANASNITITVTDNIGSTTPDIAADADSNLIYASSGGFIHSNNYRKSNEVFDDINNLNISVGRSILAHSAHFRAEAMGVGHSLQEKNFSNLTVQVNGDIHALANGDSLFIEPYGYAHHPHIASAIGHDLHHVDTAKLTIGGHILAENNTDLAMVTTATGIGSWDYLNELSNSTLSQRPLTLKSITLTVGKDVRATSTNSAFEQAAPAKVVRASAGFQNTLNGGFDNYDQFNGNVITVTGDVKADTKAGIAIAELWGYFTGENNRLSANRLIAQSETDYALSQPFYHFLTGTQNTITLMNGVKSSGGYYADAAGFARTVTKYDGQADGNTINVDTIDVVNPFLVGGFACFVDTHKNQPDQAPAMVQNVALTLDHIKATGPGRFNYNVGGFVTKANGTLTNNTVTIPLIDLAVNNQAGRVGGFIALLDDKNNSPISDAEAHIGSLQVAGYGDIGGFIGRMTKSASTMTNASASLGSLRITGNAANIETNHQNVGGFIGYQHQGNITAASAYVNDSIHTATGNYVNVGGFRGIGYDFTDQDNAAQVGEDIFVQGNIGPTKLGGYTGSASVFKSAFSIDQATALVFGKISGETSHTNKISAGFIGDADHGMLTGAASAITQSAAFVGKEISSNTIPENWESNMATAVGYLSNTRLENFTVLVDVGKDPYAMSSAGFSYISVSSALTSDFSNNYFVAVEETGRTAYPLTIKNGLITLGSAPIGTIQIARRPFQKDYWGVNASQDAASLPYTDFAYAENTGGITFTQLSRDADAILNSNPATAILATYANRHAALLATDTKVIYDILGIYGSSTDVYITFDENHDQAPEPKQLLAEQDT